MIVRSSRRKYLLPEEHRKTYAEHQGIRSALEHTRLWLVVLWVIPAGIGILKSMQTRVWFTFPIPVIISWLFSFMMWHSLITGENKNNHGTLSRYEKPVGFWLSIFILFLGYAMPIVGMLWGGN
jgi:hypothetical protein